MESFDLEQLFNDPDMIVSARSALRDIHGRLESAEIDYKFAMQMLGEHLPLPTDEAIAIIAANALAKRMREWDQEDFLLPLMFGVLITRGVFSNDHA